MCKSGGLVVIVVREDSALPGCQAMLQYDFFSFLLLMWKLLEK